MNENTSLSKAAGTILRRVETLAMDLRAPAEFLRELADAFAFIADENARVLVADGGALNQARFVIRSLLGDENAEVQACAPLAEGVSLVVEPAEKFADSETPIPADALLLLVDAVQAWTRTQDAVFRNALAAGTPVCVALSGTSRIDESERAAVSEYVESQMKRHGNALLIELDDADGAKLDAAGAGMLRGFLEAPLSPERVAETRRAFARALFSAAREKLRPQLEKLRETESAAQCAKNDAIFSAETAKDGNELSWRAFERECGNYRRLAENALHGIFKEHKDRILKDMLQSMSTASSLRDWWEKTFKYQLEKRLEDLGARATEKIRFLLAKDAQSLAQSASRMFGVPVAFDEAFERCGVSVPSVGEAQGGLSDQGRIVVRMASLLAGGVLATLLTVSTGGAGAFSFLSFGLPNVASEGLMKIFEGKNRKAAEPEIKKIVGEAIAANEERFCEVAKSAYEELLAALKKARNEWTKKTDEKISKMRETPANTELCGLREKCEAAFAEIGDAVAEL